MERQLKSLVLRDRDIKYVSYKTFNTYSIGLLHHVDLNSNEIEQLDANTFTFQSNLKTISVANNKIARVGAHAFKNLNQLERLNLSHNSLNKLQFDILDNVPRLKILDLSYNRLKIFSQAWSNVPTLNILDLSHNKLSNLPWESFSRLLFLKKLGLRGNPWKCNCEMKGILEVNRSLLVGSLASCQSPPRLRGILLRDLSTDTFSHCPTTKLKGDRKIIVSREILSILLPGVLLILLGTVPQSKLRKPQFWLFQLIFKLLATKRQFRLFQPKYTNVKVVGQIRFPLNIKSNRKSFEGTMKDHRKVWVKTYPSNIPIDEIKEFSMHLHLIRRDRLQSNIIQYLCFEQDQKITYLVFELCQDDLMTAVMNGRLQLSNPIDQQKYFKQLSSAVAFLHEHNVVHCNISPQNVLLKITSTDLSLVIYNFKWSNFKESSAIPKGLKLTFDRVKWIERWIAPEIALCDEVCYSTAVDVFSLGCVFYFMMTRKHPFDEIPDEVSSINDIILSQVSLAALYRHFGEKRDLASIAINLVSRMICLNPSTRIKAYEVEEQPFHWTWEKVITYFRIVGNLVQDKDNPSIIRFKKELEKGAWKIVDGKWMDRLDPVVRSDLKGFKGVAKELCGLLRAIRNKIEHFEKIRNKELREIYSHSPYGVVAYYTKRFPELVAYSYSVFEESDIRSIMKEKPGTILYF